MLPACGSVHRSYTNGVNGTGGTNTIKVKLISPELALLFTTRQTIGLFIPKLQSNLIPRLIEHRDHLPR